MSVFDFKHEADTEAWIATGGSFAPNGSSAISATSNKGDGWSVARTSEGLFTVTFTTIRANLIAAGAWMQLNAAANTRLQIGAYDSSLGTLTIRALTGALTAGSHAADTFTAGSHAADVYTAAVATTKTLTFPVQASITDETLITAHDGFNTVIFGLDVAGDGVAGDDVTINISGATTAADVAALVYTALVASNLKGWVFTDNLDGTITAVHRVPGTVGNTAWTVTTDVDVTVVNTVTGAAASFASGAFVAPTFASGAFVAPSYSDAVADISAHANNRVNFLAVFGQSSARDAE
jgi:hypothetical protein